MCHTKESNRWGKEEKNGAKREGTQFIVHVPIFRGEKRERLTIPFFSLLRILLSHSDFSLIFANVIAYQVECIRLRNFF